MNIIEKPYFYPVLILFVGVGVYANSLNNGFTFDDWPLIVHNPLVHGLDIGAIFASPYWVEHPEYGLYRPLTTWTYAVNWALLGEGALGFHVVNLLLHIANAVLLYRFLIFILQRHAAGLAALIFLLHPIQTEAVNSLVGRAELLAGFCMLIGLITYDKGQWGWTVVFLFLGCLCKEHAVTLLGLVIAYDLFKLRCLGRLLPYGIMVSAVCLFLFLRYLAVGAILLPAEPSFIDNPLGHISPWSRYATALAIAGRYAWLIIWPGVLSADYSYQAIPIVDSLEHGFLIFGFFVGAVCIALGVLSFQRKTSTACALAILFVLIPFLPVSNFLFPIGTVMAERLMYLPMMGVVMLVGVGVQAVVSRFQMVVWVVVLLALGLGLRTIWRNADWQNNYTLFASAVVAAPGSAKAHMNLGHEMQDRGNWEDALAQYGEAISIYPEYVEAHYNVGVLHQERSDRLEAFEAYRQVVSLDSLHVNAWLNMGVLWAETGDFDDAVEAFLQVVNIAPARVDAHYNLALAYQNAKRWEDAVGSYRRVLGFNSEYEDAAFNLGIILERTRQYKEAVVVFLQASSQVGERGNLALLSAGRLYIKLGQKERAKDALERFLKRWTGQESVRQHAERLLVQLNID